MKYFFLVIFLLFSLGLYSQSYTISGFVEDEESGEKLVNAVIIVKNTTNAVFSNQFGYYTITIKSTGSDTINLMASNIGYEPKTFKINFKEQTNVDFKLKNISKIDSIVITAQIPHTNTTDIGKMEVPVSQLKLIPSIGGESDIFKGMQLMPGIQAGNEGQSNLYVRGGSPDENLILLDDVPLYYVNHLGGFVSVFNTEALKSVQIYKAGFPARYGSRLSSVIDIRMKDGDMKKFRKSFSIGILNTKFLIEGPIKKDKASFLFSIRYLPFEILTRPFSFLMAGGYVFGYNFYDINGKVNYKINNKNHLYLSVYSGDDNYKIRLSQILYPGSEMKYKLVWGNRLISVRLNSIITDKFSVNTNLSYTRFRYDNVLNTEDKTTKTKLDYYFNTGIQDFMLNSTADYNFLRNYKIKFGANLIYHIFKPGITSFKQSGTDSMDIDTTYGLETINGFESRFFVENNINIGKFLMANIGLHLSDYIIDNKPYFSLQPRIVLNIIIAENLSVKAGYSEMMQYVHLLTSNNLGLTPDLWVPVTDKILPSNSVQYSAGIYKYFENKNFEVSIEGYYKLSDNLISYKEGAVFNGNAANWQDKIETDGKGTYYGLEFMLQKKQGKTTGWISYTYAKAMQQFENINYGKPFPFKYDRRHSFSIVVNHNFTDNISFSADWTFGSGYPYTMPIGRYEIVNEGVNKDLPGYFPQTLNFFYDQNILIYADRNKYRMRTYHRLDVSVNFTKEVKKGIRTWSISVYNLYNRQNPYFYYTKYDNSTKKLKLFQQSLFPIIPSFCYSLKF